MSRTKAADEQHLVGEAKAVLQANDRGGWTLPTSIALYPHQWLWDTFFIAIGRRHYDIERAKEEVRSPFRAQWKNGMVPHVIFSDTPGYHAGPELWQSSKSSPDAPHHIETTGVTQPPVAAEATVRIGELLSSAERREWYAEMYPKILRWHQWFYRERNPREDGLVRLLLSWESGMDNSPPLMEVLHKYATSRRVQFMQATKLDKIAERFRRDTSDVPASERISTLDLHAIYDLVRRMRRRHYDYRKVIQGHNFQVVDLLMNCILIRANDHLKTMAEEIGETLPPDIQHAMLVAPHALETLWDDRTGYYYNRNAVSGKLIKMPGVATFMPLYALKLPEERVQQLLGHLGDPHQFAAKYPLPSAPLNSSYFNAHRYWQGPSWVNINWFIIDGLRRNGHPKEAERLKRQTLKMVAQAQPKHGFHEYYSPLDGSVAGAPDFSWTAALTIDLLLEK
ncbi:MAG TPA: trehalase family glycosidase [Candidatus Saccharimonadales bacterium]